MEISVRRITFTTSLAAAFVLYFFIIIIIYKLSRPIVVHGIICQIRFIIIRFHRYPFSSFCVNELQTKILTQKLSRLQY